MTGGGHLLGPYPGLISPHSPHPPGMRFAPALRTLHLGSWFWVVGGEGLTSHLTKHLGYGLHHTGSNVQLEYHEVCCLLDSCPSWCIAWAQGSKLEASRK